MVKYRSYQEYIEHQGEKLTKYLPAIQKIDIEYEKIIFERYRKIDFKNKSILCVGARLGGEVRAFANLGAMAIGIDLNPGEMNPYVMYGDAHEIRFPDKSFDYLFSNSIDHFLYFDRFIIEAKRVARNIILELAIQKGGDYEVTDTIDVDIFVNHLLKNFDNLEKTEIHNKSEHINWKGKSLMLW